MNTPIGVPLWLLVILAVFAAASLGRFLLYPTWRWLWSSRSRQVIEELNPTLQLKLSPFTLARRQALADRLMLDEQVHEEVTRQAVLAGASRASVEKAAAAIARDIVPNFSPYFYFRFGYWWARNVLRALYRVRIAYIDDRALRCIEPEHAVAFVSNHRSNMDYMIINYLTAQRTMLSFGVGEWSRVWPIQPLMRAAGGYFVRRDCADPLYRILLKRYVQLATEGKVPHAMFIEGELSKDGRIGAPRLGLLNYITANFDPNAGTDLVLVPIANNYDRTVEDRNLIGHTSAEFRRRGRWFVIWSAMRFIAFIIREQITGWRSFGYAAANFGTPIYFRAWLHEQGANWPALDREQRYALIQRLGARVVHDISRLMPVTPVPLLCQIWRESPARAYSRSELVERFASLAASVRQNGGHVVMSETGIQATVERALQLLLSRGLLLRKSDDLIVPGPGTNELIVYYANSIEQFVPADES